MRLPNLPKLPKRTWLPAAFALLLLVWIYGGELLDALRAARAEVAALTVPPNPWFAGGVALLALGAVAVFAWGLAKGRDAAFRGYRLLPILAVVALCAHLFLLPAGAPLPSSAQLGQDVQAFAAEARQQVPPGGLPSQEALEAIAASLPPPPYLVRGARPRAYALSLRTGCDGPATDVAGASAGTLLVCVAQDGRHAWVTAVALPIGQRFGPPQLFGMGGAPFFKEISAPEAPGTTSAGDPDSGG